MRKSESELAAEAAGMPSYKLLVSGLIDLEPSREAVEIRRGMLILTQDGVDVGRAAAVVMNCADQRITHILLGQVPPSDDYRLAPVSLVERVDGPSIRLRLVMEAIRELPRHRPD